MSIFTLQFSMKKSLPFFFLAWAFHATAFGQIDTAPVGFNKVVCLPDSDTYCSVPFISKWEFQGLISGTPSVTGGQATVTPQSTPGWSTDKFATLYFVRMQTGAKAGMYYQISSNDSGALTLDLAGDDFAGVANGDTFAVSRFWTLGTLFPPSTQTTIVASPNHSGGLRRTQVMLPDLFTEGVNLAATRSFYLYNGVWREVGNIGPDAGNVILLPDTYFIIRHAHEAITSATNFNSMGTVESSAVSMPLATRTAGQQDNATVTGRPVPIKLQDLDLMSSGAFVGSAGTLTDQRRDTLMVFDNSTAGLNRAASGIFFFDTLTSNWRTAFSGLSVADDFEILPSTGIVIRKHTTTSGATQIWTHNF